MRSTEVNRIVEDVVMRQRDALRRTRGAAGELNVDRVVELELASHRLQRSALGRAASRGNLIEGDCSRNLRAADLDHDA
jgi:hypothetical protein